MCLGASTDHLRTRLHTKPSLLLSSRTFQEQAWRSKVAPLQLRGVRGGAVDDWYVVEVKCLSELGVCFQSGG